MITPALKEALDRAGICSLTELAERVGYAPQTLHAVNAGARACSERMAARIAGALGGVVPAYAVPALFHRSRR